METEPDEIKHRQIVMENNAFTLGAIAAFSMVLLLFIWGLESASDVHLIAGVLFLIASTFSVMGVFVCKAPVMALPRSAKSERIVESVVAVSIFAAAVGVGMLCYSISYVYAFGYILALLVSGLYLALIFRYESIAKGPGS